MLLVLWPFLPFFCFSFWWVSRIHHYGSLLGCLFSLYDDGVLGRAFTAIMVVVKWWGLLYLDIRWRTRWICCLFVCLSSVGLCSAVLSNIYLDDGRRMAVAKINPPPRLAGRPLGRPSSGQLPRSGTNISSPCWFVTIQPSWLGPINAILIRLAPLSTCLG